MYLKLNAIKAHFFVLFFFIGSSLLAQSQIKGQLSDFKTAEPLIGATVIVKGSGEGIMTDVNGRFELITKSEYPVTLQLSYMGYQTMEYVIDNASQKVKVKLKSSDFNIETVDVVASRITDKMKESALTVEAMTIAGIKETPASNFYEGLSHMKGVDLTSASLGFRVVNTRGFNSTSPVRSLQIIDGVDNASPGLNFALGNFLGASELDLMKVEIIAGASSAFYGPNAFNGVISMQTKSPFQFPGFSAHVKAGERDLQEYGIRYAKVFKNKQGKDKFAYKLNLFYMRADDWVADNDASVADLDTDNNNPGGYDAINRYGDENLYSNINHALDAQAKWQTPGLNRWHRTGYWEKDIVDYNTRNFKASLAMHYKIKDSIELIGASNFGTGTTVYQGDNRFSLKDILFFQNRIELNKKDEWFVRAYATHEDAGNSYDAVLTAFLMQDAAGDDWDWSNRYRQYWSAEITDRVRDLDPSFVWYPQIGQQFNIDGIDSILALYPDSLAAWHAEAEDVANQAYAPFEMTDFFQPGTAAFDSMLQEITSKTSFLEGGSRIKDKSALYHIHAERKFDTKIALFTIGANGRLYTPKSEGSLFIDTGDVVITNREVGLYGGFEKRTFDDRMILKSTVRLDKNENFPLLVSPAASVVLKPTLDHTVRMTFSSAIRNPTLLNQYMYYNIGRAKLVGNISGYDSLVTLESLGDFLVSQNRDTLNYFNLGPIEPERVRSIEMGYRGTVGKRLYVDASWYYSWYRNFIGFVTGADIFVTSINTASINDIYRIATNSDSLISTQGFSIGLNYYLGKYFAINGNYSWNKLNKNVDDPIIPAYNTPEHKYNIGFSGRDIFIEGTAIRNLGFNINYKWIQGFVYEGSPQFTGNVPTYDYIDAQVNYKWPQHNITAKMGVSNLLNNKVLHVYGGPYIGRLAYLSISFDWDNL